VTRPGQLLMFAVVLLSLAANSAFAAPTTPQDKPIIPQLTANPTATASTVPGNGDLNPYGVAFVPFGFPSGGAITAGEILVSNFNASDNHQGTGTTIISVPPNGKVSQFYQNSATPGLSTALGVLKAGFVLVGNVPSLDGSGVCTESNGKETDVGAGSLVFIDRHGSIARQVSSPAVLNGPWDLTVFDNGTSAQVFIADALSARVVRLDLLLPNSETVALAGATQIASGYVHRCDPAAFVVGPTGVAFDAATDTLYVASSGDNAIYTIPNASTRHTDAGKGNLLTADSIHLHGPLGLLLAPNGDLISAQGDAVNPDPNQVSELVEFNSAGEFVSEVEVDPAAGGAFGLALESLKNGGFVFAAVDDNINALKIWVVE